MPKKKIKLEPGFGSASVEIKSEPEDDGELSLFYVVRAILALYDCDCAAMEVAL